MAQPLPTKPGNTKITPVGQTSGNKYGQDPMVKERGVSSPTPQTFGKGS